MKRTTCPFCDGQVLFDDTGREVSHREPVCHEFDGLMMRSNPTRVRHTWRDSAGREIKAGQA